MMMTMKAANVEVLLAIHAETDIVKAISRSSPLGYCILHAALSKTAQRLALLKFVVRTSFLPHSLRNPRLTRDS